MNLICDGRFYIDFERGGQDNIVYIVLEDRAADNVIFIPISCVEPLVEYLQHLAWVAGEQAKGEAWAKAPARVLPRPAMLEDEDGV